MAAPMTVDERLDVWAAVQRHRSEGGRGFPTLRECTVEPEYVAPSNQIADRSDLIYDGTRNKYDRIPPDSVGSDSVMSAWESVERALSALGAGDWLKDYVAHLHPKWGRYAVRTDADSRSFVEGGRMDGIKGVPGENSGKESAAWSRAVHATYCRLRDQVQADARGQ